MAVVVVQFGQCGNQIGHGFFSTLMKDVEINKPGVTSPQNQSYTKNCLDQWFSRTSEKDLPSARAVLVDTENKVINDIQQRQSGKCNWTYNTRSIVLQSGGAGNNWANGYQVKGPALLEHVLDCIRQQAEECDRLSTILNLFSTAGGTGSGVGSFCIENIRDEYPTKAFAGAAVLPFEEGEVVTQSYNTVMTLSKIYNICDGTFLFSNDHLQKMTASLLMLKDINILDLNSLIARKMAAVLQVQRDDSTVPVKIADTLCHLVPHPAFKFCSIKSTPHVSNESKNFESSLRWSVLSQHLKRSLRLSSAEPEMPCVDWELRLPTQTPMPLSNPHYQYYKSVSNLLVTKGPPASQQEGNFADEFVQNNLYPTWTPSSSFLHHHQSRKFLDMEKFAALATNNGQMNKNINSVVSKAWKLFTQKAFLHQYTKYDLMEEDFIAAFIKMESVVKNYESLK